MQSSIVINVPPSDKDVIIAIPFSDEFSSLSSQIEQAINLSKLTPYRVDLQMQDENFVKELLRKTQSCRMIIGVCSAENETGKANPNVMYELGLGRGIGKPILILTNDTNSLPSDLDGKHVLKYDESEIKEKAFINKLCFNISILKERVKDEYIDKSFFPNIWVGNAAHVFSLRQEIWSEFISALKYAKEIHNIFQDYDTAHINRLHHCIEELFIGISPKSKPKKVAEFSNLWGNYQLAFEKNAEFWNMQESSRNKCAASLDTLNKIEDKRIKSIVGSCSDFVTNISNQIDLFREFHEKICEKTKDSMISVLDNETDIQRLWAEVGQLSKNCKGVVTHADTLILNIVDIIE